MNPGTRLLYLIRHGATEANLRRPYTLQGQRVDLPLSERGRQQAEATRRMLANQPICAMFSSPLRRALETALIVAQPHGLTAQPVQALVECDVGDWEGLSWDEIQKHDPDYLQKFEADPANVPYAGGESYQQVQDRASPALSHILQNSNGNVAIVTHNIVGRVTVAMAIDIPTAKSRNIQLDNGGISIFAVQHGTLRLITLNSALHLDPLLEHL